jgi:hypothetical protein
MGNPVSLDIVRFFGRFMTGSLGIVRQVQSPIVSGTRDSMHEELSHQATMYPVEKIAAQDYSTLQKVCFRANIDTLCDQFP